MDCCFCTRMHRSNFPVDLYDWAVFIAVSAFTLPHISSEPLPSAYLCCVASKFLLFLLLFFVVHRDLSNAVPYIRRCLATLAQMLSISVYVHACEK